ncbi:5-formyltetrahydrofolate cyclo-ligase [Devosia sp. CN2-171]|uniref:5-formyltetrahydrofolate cyclo-ligase n=1 Tax=Devosia sp. CN2-171 TaxID=3400909 RepID=UPI003BF796A3
MTTVDLGTAWQDIRARMMQVALPDSRFDMDLDSFIPAFTGVDTASRSAAGQSPFIRAKRLFITPDNSMQELRHLALAAGKTVLIPTYGLKRGFLKLDPARFDPALALYASWGDGGEHFGTFVPIPELPGIGRIDLCLVGAAAVTTSGLRFGMGHRYFDVEWNIFAAAGLVSDATPVWTVVHEAQVIEATNAGGLDEVPVDMTFTPDRTIAMPQAARPAVLRVDTLALLFGATPPAAVVDAVRCA